MTNRTAHRITPSSGNVFADLGLPDAVNLATKARLSAAMHNPPHPGKVLREYLGAMEVAEAAKRLQVSRTTLSRVLNSRAGISADMSLRLADALGTHPAFWSGLQMDYDLWHAARKRRPRIQPFRRAA
ncbi:MAG: HigA family addiction module antitoxin [Acidobacteriaceae bacterium]